MAQTTGDVVRQRLLHLSTPPTTPTRLLSTRCRASSGRSPADSHHAVARIDVAALAARLSETGGAG
jgi:hypothetical protein